MDPLADTPRTAAQRPTRRLLAVKLMLVVCVGGIAVFDGLDDAWPFVGWPMYASFAYPGPPTELVTNVAVVTDDTGTVTTLATHEIVTDNEILWLERITNSAASATPKGAADRAFLVALVRARLGDRELRQIEIVRLKWAVDHTQTPPYDAQQPDVRESLGTIVITDTGVSLRSPSVESGDAP